VGSVAEDRDSQGLEIAIAGPVHPGDGGRVLNDARHVAVIRDGQPVPDWELRLE